MEIKVQSEESQENDSPVTSLESEKKTLIQVAISQTIQSTAHLDNLQLLSPICTNQGDCDSVSRSMTAALVLLCGLSCFLTSFTESFRNKNGNGRCLLIKVTTLPSEFAAKYRLRSIDFMHAFMSILVFAAVALFDKNLDIITALPAGIGVCCNMLFVVFPTTRHEVGFPLSAK
ncbi:hypothetical protein GQ457_01G006840 [Hibiscus cannabinus]